MRRAQSGDSRGLARLLPTGLNSDGMWLLAAQNWSSRQVGVLWVGPHPDGMAAGYVYDIEIEESQREREIGRAAMDTRNRSSSS